MQQEAASSTAYIYDTPAPDAYPSITPHLNIHNLFIKSSKETGRGIYASIPVERGTVIEISPVLVIPKDEYIHGAGKSCIKDYVFSWGKDGSQALALGIGSLFNHSASPNIAFKMDIPNQCITYTSTKAIEAGEELCIFYGHHVSFGQSDQIQMSRMPADEPDILGGMASIDLVETYDIAPQATSKQPNGMPASTNLEVSAIIKTQSIKQLHSEPPVPIADLPFDLVTSVVDPEDQPLRLRSMWAIEVSSAAATPAIELGMSQGWVTPDLKHLRRIRRTPVNDGSRDFRLNCLLLPTELDTEESLARMLEASPKLGPLLGERRRPFSVQVPATPAHTPKQLSKWAEYWPVTYVPIRAGPAASIRQRDWVPAKLHWMVRQLRELQDWSARERLNGGVGAVCRVTESWDSTLHDAQRTPITLAEAADGRVRTGNQLCHCFVSAISHVSSLDVKSMRPQLLMPAVNASGSAPAYRKTVPYLLTGLTVFATHEPCLLCSMALLHSRIGVLVYIKPSPGAGGCGSVYNVHEQEGLNHRFEVWRWNGKMNDSFGGIGSEDSGGDIEA